METTALFDHKPALAPLPGFSASVVTDGDESHRRPAQWPHRPESGQLCLWVREPSLLANLKTHPGGHRGLRRFDPRIRALWRLLVDHADSADYTLILNKSAIAALLSVHRNTVSHWLNFFERYQLVKILNAGGGRGVQLEITWLKRGQVLQLRRQRALKYQRAKADKRRAAQQGQKALAPNGDSKNRALLMQRARMALTARIRNPTTASEAVTAFGRWLWKERPGSEAIEKVFTALAKAKRIPVPRWVQTAQDVHRWMRSLIAKLLRYGAAWWGRLQRVVARRRLERTLARVKAAVDAGKPCPICAGIHDRAGWREGRDSQGRLVCPGWARVRLDELRPQAPERPRREDTNEDLRRRWIEERQQYQTPLWWYS